MIYLLTQILLCLALAAVLGGAIGWLLQSARSARRFDAARRALAAQARQLERAQSDVGMLTDDFDDLRERSRVEIDALRQENRQLPALTDNLEKSQLLVRQMLQRHESREREFDAGNAMLEERIARLQEQVVTQERALAAAARAAEGRTSERSGAGVAAHDGGTDAVNIVDVAPDGTSDDGRSPFADEATDGRTHTVLANVTGDGPLPPAGTGIGATESSNVTAMPRRGWASLPLIGGDGLDAADETMDEVMEVDDDLAAELREGIDTNRPAPDATDDGSTGSVGSDGEESGDESGDWDDEEANATLAIEVFSLDDLHGVDDLGGSTTPTGDVTSAAGTNTGLDGSRASVAPSSRPLFRPVDRQDDLQRLFGIGPVTEKALNALGITSYPQLAKLERPEIEKIAEALDIVPERIESDDWVGNARRQLEDVLEEL